MNKSILIIAAAALTLVGCGKADNSQKKEESPPYRAISSTSMSNPAHALPKDSSSYVSTRHS